MKECCDKWIMELSPKTPRDGKFVEVRQCPTCKTQHKVIFQCAQMLGGEWTCAAVGVE